MSARALAPAEAFSPPSTSRFEQSGTVARALAVLRVIAESNGEVSVKQVSDALGLPMSTAHRLLDLLSAEGYVTKNIERRRYRAGLEWLRVSNLILARETLPTAAAPILADLTHESGETVVLALFQPGTATMIIAAKCDSPQPLRYQVEMFAHRPIVRSSPGLAILAFLGPREQLRAIEAAASASAPPQNDPAFRQRLAEIAAQGHVVGEADDTSTGIGIAVPLRGPNGTAIGSLTLITPPIRFVSGRTEALAASLKAAAARLMTRTAQINGKNND